MESLKLVAEASAQLVTWGLAVAAASVAAIVSTDYLQPGRKLRWIYLLFLPAWGCIATSVYWGNQVSRRYIAAAFVSQDNVSKIAAFVNSDFASQQFWLSVALGFFAAWLVLFLLWWVFSDDAVRKRAT